MGNLNANAEALRAHASLCEGLATALDTTALDTGTAPACPETAQPTAAAVAALHASFDAVGSALAGRMRATATAVHATADGLDTHERNSADRLRATDR